MALAVSTSFEARSERAAVFLQPGHLHAARTPTTITTILASCVGVCLFDNVLRVGGMNHYLLPHALAIEGMPGRFGFTATRLLVERLVAMGCRVRDMQAKVFGGAAVIEALAAHREHMPVGQANSQCAFDFLRDAGIRVVASDVGGSRGRKIIFHTDDGTALMKFL